MINQFGKSRRLRALRLIGCFGLLAFAPVIRGDVTQTLLALAGTGTNGVCAFPRCSSLAAEWALTIATNSGLLVHAMNTNAAVVAALRDQARAASVLCGSLYIEVGGLAALPYASESLDALFITDLTDADLVGFPTAEVLRVLAPCVGRAVLGHAGGAPGSLSQAALSNWVAQLPMPNLKVHITNDVSGLWAVITRPALAGADDWTHPLHGPDNNPASKDTAFSFQSAVAWLGKPYQLSWRNVGGRIVADGRLYMAFGPNDVYKYRAYNLYNGALLWERTLDTNTWAQRHLNACIRGDRIYLMQQAYALVLDAATGAEVDRITFTNVTGQGKWMAISSNLLVMLIGPMDIRDSGWLGDRNAMFPKRDALNIGHGTHLVAYDLDARAERWRVDEGARIDGRTVGISTGRIFYHAPTNSVVCRALMSGAVLWTNADAAVMALMGQKFGANSVAWWGPSAAAGLEDRYSMVCTPDATYFGTPEGGSFVALASTDGHLLWSKTRNGGRVINFVVCTNDKMYVNGVVTSGVVHPLTGALVANASGFGGCGVATVNQNYLMGQIGGPGYDFARLRSLVLNNGGMMYPVKAECSLGGIIAGGRYVSLAKNCTCPVMRGSIGLCSGRPHATPTGRLETGGGDYTGVVGLPLDELDWSTYRGAQRHAGATTVGIAVSVTNLWRSVARFSSQQYTLEQYSRTVQRILTPPVTAGDMLFVCASDGLVQCLDSAGGAELWRFQADGAILAAPTVADGRLFFGSADGWVYALDAATGRFLWRYRVGPEDRKIMVYGYLQSCWPVNSGVVVQNGRVHVAAGLSMQPGSYVCALDAATGQLIWRNNATGPRFDQANGTYGDVTRVPGGYMASVSSSLWVRAFQAGMIGMPFNLQTGTNVADVNPNSLRGRDIGLVSNRFLIWGGQDVYADTVERDGKWSYGFGEVSNGVARKYSVDIPAVATPAWTDERLMIPVSQTIECWSTPATVQYFGDLINKQNSNWQFIIPQPVTNPSPMLLWRAGATNVYALAMSANLVIAAVVTNKNSYGVLSEFGARLRAFDVTTGAQVWDVRLPSAPVRNGLCIDRHGRIFVSLHDGSVVCFSATNEAAKARLAEDGCGSATLGAGINGNDGGAGWSGAWRAGNGDVYTNGLTYLGWDARGLAMLVSSNAARQYSGTTSGAHGATNWFSFLFQTTTPNAGQAICWFSNGDADSGIGASMDSADNGSVFAAMGASRATIGATNAQPGATYLVIGQAVWSTNAGEDRLSIWLDPASWASEADVAASAKGASAMQANAPARFDAASHVFIANAAGTPGAALVCDEIRLGTTLQSVLPIPEPAQFVGLLAVVLWRRMGAPARTHAGR